MEEILKATTTYTNGYEDELVTELLDDVSPFFVSTQNMNNYSADPFSIIDMVSSDFQVPTIENFDNVVTNEHSFRGNAEAQTRMTILEKGLNKIENRYILKIKICESSMSDDGYKWRKYGQKSIKNNPNPRSYYKCTNPICSAKKQVERSNDDTDTLIVTYEGLHLHYTYPFFTHSPDQKSSPPTKKSKIIALQAQAHEQVKAQVRKSQDTEKVNANRKSSTEDPFIGIFADPTTEGLGPQGLLEDVVPLVIRKASNNNYFTSSSSSCSSYNPSLPNSPSSQSWSPNYYSTLFDLGYEL